MRVDKHPIYYSYFHDASEGNNVDNPNTKGIRFLYKGDYSELLLVHEYRGEVSIACTIDFIFDGLVKDTLSFTGDYADTIPPSTYIEHTFRYSLSGVSKGVHTIQLKYSGGTIWYRLFEVRVR